MINRKSKIGFSDVGGIYIGQNIQTNKHQHNAITVAISFGKPFNCRINNLNVSSTGLVMQANTHRKIINPENNYIAFIHIEPFSEQGLQLTNKNKPYKKLTLTQTKNIIKTLKEWFSNNEINEKTTLKVINEVFLKTEISSGLEIDERIKESIKIIKTSNKITLKEISERVCLSTYRFSHLFKQQTGVSFKKFVLYTKLVKSLKSICESKNFTHSSYYGGFADQAHFTRTYYKAFGILPSQSIK